MGLFATWFGSPDHNHVALNAQREADRELIRETIRAMKETQIETARMLAGAIKDIASVQTAQASAIKTHLDLFKAPQEALDSALDKVPEVDEETQMGDFPWNATPEDQQKWLNAELDED